VTGEGLTVVRGGWGLFYDKIVYNASLFTDIDYVGVRGVEIIGGDFPGGVVPFSPGTMPSFEQLWDDYGFGMTFDPIIVPGYQFAKSAQYTIGMSHQFTPTLVLDADFIRSEGDERGRRYDINERKIAGDTTSRLFYPEQMGRLRVTDSVGVDTYNGLQLSLRKRFANSMQFVANYTLSEVYGNAESNFGSEAECVECQGDEADIGPYTNDSRHRIVLGGVFVLPADFQASLLFQGESGRALSATSSVDENGNGRRIADWMPGPNGEPRGRGNFRGDPTYTVDFRLAKFFRFGDVRSLQIMAEFFNLFNRVNWGNNLETTFQSANFGQPTGELRIDQFQMQLGIRFTF
jgi:hypothetical protein